MLRAFLPTTLSDDSLDASVASDELQLSKEEARHLIKARRAKVGDLIEVLDGQGNVASAEIVSSEPVLLRVRDRRHVPRLQPRVTLVQALPKSQKFELILQKATELGVTAVAPVESANCEARIVAGRGESKAERRRQILIEACKQSGNPWLPTLHPACSLRDFLADNGVAASCDVWLLATQHEAQRPIVEAAAGQGSVGVFIGPEGDFSAAEKAAILAFGARPVSLGSWTLRSETAAIAALAKLL